RGKANARVHQDAIPDAAARAAGSGRATGRGVRAARGVDRRRAEVAAPACSERPLDPEPDAPFAARLEPAALRDGPGDRGSAIARGHPTRPALPQRDRGAEPPGPAPTGP